MTRTFDRTVSQSAVGTERRPLLRCRLTAARCRPVRALYALSEEHVVGNLEGTLLQRRALRRQLNLRSCRLRRHAPDGVDLSEALSESSSPAALQGLRLVVSKYALPADAEDMLLRSTDKTSQSTARTGYAVHCKLASDAPATRLRRFSPSRLPSARYSVIAMKLSGDFAAACHSLPPLSWHVVCGSCQPPHPRSDLTLSVGLTMRSISAASSAKACAISC